MPGLTLIDAQGAAGPLKSEGPHHLGDLLFGAAVIVVLGAVAALMWSTATATFFP